VRETPFYVTLIKLNIAEAELSRQQCPKCEQRSSCPYLYNWLLQSVMLQQLKLIVKTRAGLALVLINFYKVGYF